MLLIQRPCYQRGSLYQDQIAKRTTRGAPEHRKETQTEVVWSCLPFIRYGQKKILRGTVKGGRRQGRQEERWEDNTQDRPGVRQVPDGSGEQGKMEETGFEVICGAPTTPTVKAQVKVEVNCILMSCQPHRITPERFNTVIN